MRTRPFGPTGRQVSVIGQGTWNLDRKDRATAVKALQAGMDAGMNHIDTAEMYGDAELVVAEAIAGRRDEVFLVSKVLPSNASARGVRTACERSLKRLGVERLDCYLLHWRGSVPLNETIEAFEALKREGKIASWGVSNFDTGDLEQLVASGGRAVACNQVLYHLGERAIEHAVIPWCTARGMAVVAYSPFGSGDFPSAETPAGRVLADVARGHDVSPRQVALAFLTRNAWVFAIPMTSSPEHAQDNAAAADLQLTPDEVTRIDRAFPRGPKPRGLPMI